MLDLRRIRIDDQGLLIQTARGALGRIALARETIDRIKQDPAAQLVAMTRQNPELGTFYDPHGELHARIDVADEPGACLSRPLRIYYNLEPGCNLDCAFCGPRDLSGWNERVSMERETFFLDQIAAAGAFQVQLTGGEIFLRGWRLLAVLERTRALGLATLLGTNGVWDHIPDREVFLRELAGFEHLIEIKVSIDGDQAFHDSVRGAGNYERSVRTVFDLTRHGLPVRINTTIFKESCTLEQIEHLAALAKRAGARLQAIPERSCGRAGGRARYELPSAAALRAYTLRASQLRAELGIGISLNFDVFGGGQPLPNFDGERPFSCGAGLWGFAVTHLGEVYPCGFTIDLHAPRSFHAGTISRETSLLEIWQHSSVLREWRHAGKSPQCQACDYYRRTCWGGCMVQALVTHGRLNAMDPYAICTAAEV